MNHEQALLSKQIDYVELVTGHLKSNHRMMRNYLMGTLGDPFTR